MNNLKHQKANKMSLANIVGKKCFFGTLDSEDERYFLDSNFWRIGKLKHEISLQAWLSHKLINHCNSTTTNLYQNRVTIKLNLGKLNYNVKLLSFMQLNLHLPGSPDIFLWQRKNLI